MIAATHINRPSCTQDFLVVSFARLFPIKTVKTLCRFLLCFCILLGHFAHSQESQVNQDRKLKQLPFTYAIVKDWDSSFSEMLESWFSKPHTNVLLDVGKTYWFKIDLKNELDTLQTQDLWRLRSNHFNRAQLYFKDGDSIATHSFGRFKDENEKRSLRHGSGAVFRYESLISGRYLYVKAKNHFEYPYPVHFGYLSNDANRFYTDYYSDQDLEQITPSLLFLGGCAILFLTFAVIFLNVRRLEFLFYSFYVFFLCGFLTGLDIPRVFTLFDSELGFWALTISQVLINLFYVLFAKFYLNTEKQYPLLDIIIKIIVLVLILIVLAHGIAYFSEHYQLQSNILNFQRLLMTLFGLFAMVYLLLLRKDILACFIVAGSFCYMLGALAFWLMYSKHYMILGSMLEIMIFSLGLAYKIKLEYEDKVILQREVSLKDISAKRAQINPHFFFNSLGSIQHLILHDKKNAALNYLNKFSKLARSVLESSYETTVTLTEEIELLRSYLELESLRFDKAFSYTITVADSVNTDAVEIPLMLIQPFAENAIIHGLMGKKTGEKKLEFRFFMETEYLVIEIEDNGVGRYYEKTKKSRKKSRGMEITKKRLQMRDTSDLNKNSIEIIDKYDTQSQPSGTKVIIRLNNP